MEISWIQLIKFDLFKFDINWLREMICLIILINIWYLKFIIKSIKKLFIKNIY